MLLVAVVQCRALLQDLCNALVQAADAAAAKKAQDQAAAAEKKVRGLVCCRVLVSSMLHAPRVTLHCRPPPPPALQANQASLMQRRAAILHLFRIT